MAEDSPITMTSEIASAYLVNHKVPPSDLPALIQSIYKALTTLADPAAVVTPVIEPLSAAAVKKSITGDHLISFINGQKMKSLKRHLTVHGLTPATYRERFGLPASYPMVAPSYAAARSQVAKEMGLGRKAGINSYQEASVSPVEAPEPAPAPTPAVSASEAAAKPKRAMSTRFSPSAPKPQTVAAVEAPVTTSAPVRRLAPGKANPKAVARPKKAPEPVTKS